MIAQNTTDGNESLRKLIRGQSHAVLATDDGVGPYTSLMAIAVTDDMKAIHFVTAKSTRKWSNLLRNRHVSLLIDNRNAIGDDLSGGFAATIQGLAEEAAGMERERALAFFLGRHPDMAAFATAPNVSLFTMRIETIYLAGRFGQATEFNFSPTTGKKDEKLFGIE